MGKTSVVISLVTILFFVGCGNLKKPENGQVKGGKLLLTLTELILKRVL